MSVVWHALVVGAIAVGCVWAIALFALTAALLSAWVSNLLDARDAKRTRRHGARLRHPAYRARLDAEHHLLLEQIDPDLAAIDFTLLRCHDKETHHARNRTAR